MAFVLYLAMTAAEFHTDSPLPCPTAWMACHFSPYGTALSNLPSALPKGSLLILNDRTPVFGHNPERIAQQLAETAEQFECSGILLDFQRPDEDRTGSIAEAIAALPYPVAVTPQYAEKLDCAVFLPPPPMTTPLKTHLAPWQGRKIWLEAAMEKQCVRVDKTGSKALPWDGDPLPCPIPMRRFTAPTGSRYIRIISTFSFAGMKRSFGRYWKKANSWGSAGLWDCISSWAHPLPKKWPQTPPASIPEGGLSAAGHPFPNGRYNWREFPPDPSSSPPPGRQGRPHP